ncbi:MAG: efflux transporter, family, subunit [Firmicutes bacterium]|nr:efflux transporter, family, subunit [Bacillota bacterium]
MILKFPGSLKAPQNKWKTIGIVVGVLLVLLIAYKIYANLAISKERAARALAGRTVTVETAMLERRDLVPTFSFSANLEAVWSTDVSAKADGRIDQLLVEEGDLVQAGMILARLDTNELAAQVMQAEGQVLQAKATLEQNELNFRRMDTLSKQNAVSLQSLDSARTQRDLAQGGVHAAEGNLLLLQTRLQNANIISPLTGVVVKRYVQAGTFSKAGAAIVAVADVTSLLAKALVGEAQISELKLGIPVTVRVNALKDQEFTGTLTRLSPAATLPARTFTAEVNIPNPTGLLKAGMFAKAEIAGHVRTKVLAVPESALVLREDQKTIFVVAADNKVVQKVLKLGNAAGGWVEVLDGVKEGEEIVVAGQHKLKDGASIRIGKPGEASK